MSNPLLDTTGLPKFDAIKPHHAVPALETLITAHKRRLDTLLAANHTTKFESIIEPIEDMYHELNRIWSPISHLQSVLDSVEWREVYIPEVSATSSPPPRYRFERTATVSPIRNLIPERLLPVRDRI